MLKEAVIQFRSVRGILSISVRNAPDSVRVEGGGGIIRSSKVRLNPAMRPSDLTFKVIPGLAEYNYF